MDSGEPVWRISQADIVQNEFTRLKSLALYGPPSDLNLSNYVASFPDQGPYFVA